MDSKQFTEKVCEILKNHKAVDIVSIDLTEKSAVADYFVIAGGTSMRHTRSLIEKVDEEMEKLGVAPTRTEGVREGRWAVLDYGDVIVHLFNDESRLFYHLETLWDDGKNVKKY